ncbi:MAG: carboxypeptidase-like regulatory domain-containing protein [Bacteroidales bacterium]|nr:carboxypeptidase-like regulatory domain-containing protein [Bacteroidales bacterium]
MNINCIAKYSMGLLALLLALPLWAEGPLHVVGGVVRDAKSKKPIVNAVVAAVGSNIATVTNDDGEFALKLVDADVALEVSCLGYRNAEINMADASSPLVVLLQRAPKQLKEVTVYSGDPRGIVEAALQKIPEAYSSTTDRLTLFYRETIQKGNRYMEVAEGVIDALKSDYGCRTIDYDRVQVVKGRKLLSQRRADTLSVKVAGGPMLALSLDFVKNEDFFLSKEELDNYHFSLAAPAMLNDRQQYVVEFKPCRREEYPLMKGILYIDAEGLTFTRAEFEMDLSDRALAVRSILYKKPRGLRFSPKKVAFTVSYRQGDDGQTYLNYIRNEMRFKCDWSRRLFSSTYIAVSEMVVVDREADCGCSIAGRDAFRQKERFSDVVVQYWDADFWERYNIIEPSESLEKAVARLLR